MNARDTTLPLRSLIAQHLSSVEDATVAQIARAVGQKDFPSRVVAELNAMRTDALIECERRGKSKDLSYWLAVPVHQVIDASPVAETAAGVPFDLPEDIKIGTRAAQIWDVLRGDAELTAREIAAKLKCSAGSLDPVISALFKSGTIGRTKGQDRVYRYHRPRNDQHESPAGGGIENTGSDRSAAPSGNASSAEAVAVHEKTAPTPPSSSPEAGPAAEDVTDDDDSMPEIDCGAAGNRMPDNAMPDTDPALLAAANRTLSEQSDALSREIEEAAEMLALFVDIDIDTSDMELTELAKAAGGKFADLEHEVAMLKAETLKLLEDLRHRTDSLHNACAALGKIGERLGTDPDEGGAGPILDAIEKLVSAHHNQAALSHKLETLLTSKTHECEALRAHHQPQSHQGLCASEINSFAVLAAKRPLRRFYARDRAVESAMRAAANGSSRAEVFALVPIGRAVRGAEWRDA